jgi:ATP synthase protein I
MSVSGKDRDPGRGELSPEDREAFRRRAAELGQRLDDVKERRAPPSDDPGARGAAMGQAFKIAIDLVVGVGAGGFIGWTLDRQLGTGGPWFLVLFLVLGFAAGLLNVVRSARRMQARAEPMQRSAPSVTDDEDDR